MKTIEVKITFASNGSVDTDATLAQVAEDLAKYEASLSADNTTIGLAVSRVWEENQNLKNMNLDALASFAIRHIPDVKAQAFTAVSERIKDYVRSNTETYAMTKGKGGGVQNLSRLTEEELAKVKASQAKAAAKAA